MEATPPERSEGGVHRSAGRPPGELIEANRQDLLKYHVSLLAFDAVQVLKYPKLWNILLKVKI